MSKAKEAVRRFLATLDKDAKVEPAKKSKRAGKSRTSSRPKQKERPIGLAKGKIKVPASFFEDLPEETLALYQTIPKSSFPKTTLDKVALCLPVSGKGKSLQEMNAAIKKGAKKRKR